MPNPNSKFPFFWQRGQTTLEIIIAVTILVAGITAAILTLSGGQSASLDSAESNIALRLAQREIEKINAQARYDFVSIASSSATENEFTKNIIVSSVNTSTKLVTVRVSWQIDPLRAQKVELVTHVTDWQYTASSGGDTGGTGTTGDWSNPRTLGSVDLGAGNSATDLDVKNKIIYITATASDSKKPDFFIVDATDGQNPVVNVSINTGPGLNAVDVAGNYAYVANNKTSSQLQILDVSSNSTTSLVSSLDLSSVSGSGAVGNSIFYNNSKIYIGTKQANGPEFHIIDVSNASAPSEFGSYEVGADVNSIRVSGNTAYLATSDDSNEVLILDVSNPASIGKIGSFNATSTYDGLGLYLVGNKLYLGRQSGNSDELQVLNIANASSVVSLGVANIGSNVNALTIRDNLAFLGTSDSNNEFQVWDISNPSSITKISSFNFPQVAQGIDFENNLVYVAVRSNDALRIITSQ